jgi:hypothetical protein
LVRDSAGKEIRIEIHGMDKSGEGFYGIRIEEKLSRLREIIRI